MSVGKVLLQYFEDFDAEIFRGGHRLGEFFQSIQILKVIAGKDFPFDRLIEMKTKTTDAALSRKSGNVAIADAMTKRLIAVRAAVDNVGLSVG